jgi:hypothetical protein
VTVIRNASHLPAILTPKPSHSASAPSYIPPSITAAQSDTAESPTPVVLVPLGDSPTLPSLSLLMSEGTTTTTAVCFQQDLLDRARRTEEEWLPSAVEQIRIVVRMRDEASRDGSKERPIILAYSANPGLSPSTIAACIEAGASGVLKPPYDAKTTELVRRMAKEAKDGSASSAANTPIATPQLVATDLSVNLTPTALLGGGEHETERVLSSHRRKMSGAQDILPPPGVASSSKSEVRPRRDLPSLSISASKANKLDPLDAEMDNLTFGLYLPSLQRRRRSVDTGGLAAAMQRAQKAFDGAARPLPLRGLASGSPTTPRMRPFDIYGMTPDRDTRTETGVDDVDTHLAELLGAMYYQTCLTIDVEMGDYEEYVFCSSRKFSADE